MRFHLNYKLSGAAGQFRLPNYPGNSKPSNPELGDLILNSTTATLEVWTGDRWAVCGGGNRGGSQVILQSLEEMLLRMDNKHLEMFGLQYCSGAFQFEYDAGDRYGTGDLEVD